MSQNNTLKAGDLVRYMGMNPDMGRHGFASGQIYMVSKRDDGSLYMQNGHGVQLTLVDSNGQLTDYCDSVSKHACPVVLPQGLNKVGAV